MMGDRRFHRVAAKRREIVVAGFLLLVLFSWVGLGTSGVGVSMRREISNDIAVKRTVADTKLASNDEDGKKSKGKIVSSTNPTPIFVRNRLVVSMKTMPNRIQYIQPTLDSLVFQQKYQPDDVYLVLPQQPSDSPQYTIPSFVSDYAKKGYIKILRPEHDYGALDKMIHALAVEDDLYSKQQSAQPRRRRDQFRILYVDDDMIYDERHIEILVRKGDKYPNDVVALSGGTLRSHFRQIGHSNPRSDRHPYLYYKVGGVDSQGDPEVDIVQGFMGVLLRLSFFKNVSHFLQVAGNQSFPDGVRNSDDFIISGYLARKEVSVTRRMVDGGLPPIPNPTIPSEFNTLAFAMHRNAMIAASYLQREWDIWSKHKFEPYLELSRRLQNLIDCEALQKQFCPPDVKDARGRSMRLKATQELDRVFNISNGPKMLF